MRRWWTHIDDNAGRHGVVGPDADWKRQWQQLQSIEREHGRLAFGLGRRIESHHLEPAATSAIDAFVRHALGLHGTVAEAFVVGRQLSPLHDAKQHHRRLSRRIRTAGQPTFIQFSFSRTTLHIANASSDNKSSAIEFAVRESSIKQREQLSIVVQPQSLELVLIGEAADDERAVCVGGCSGRSVSI